MDNRLPKLEHLLPMMLAATLLAPLFTLGVSRSQVAHAQTATGVIAYIETVTQDAIRLVEPDGSNDRLLWAVPQPDPRNTYYISGLAWKPDGSELVFAGNHEDYCSLYDQDLYGVRPDGSGYRRITNGPACSELAAYPQGSVRVKVNNTGFATRNISVNMEGANQVQQLTLPPQSSGEVLFDQVADLGDSPQFAVGIEGFYRWINAASVDVRPGELVETAPLLVDQPDTIYAAYRPSWRYDGASLAFTFSLGAFWRIEANPPLMAKGEHLFTARQNPNAMGPAVYAPVAARADQLIYYSSNMSETAIYLVSEGATDGGTPLVGPAWDEFIQYGQAWLPDGSGFLYATRSIFGGSKLYEYSFATNSASLVAEFTDFIAFPAVSPDGQQIVFERAAAMDDLSGMTADPDLWIINRDGSGLRLLVENGRLPAWSLQNPTVPPVTPTPSPQATMTATPVATPEPQQTPSPTSPGETSVFLPTILR